MISIFKYCLQLANFIQFMHECRTINIFWRLGLKNITSQYSRNIVEMNPATARCRVAACEVLSTAVTGLLHAKFCQLQLQVCCTRHFDKSALTGMFPANNPKTKPDIDMISAPECVSPSKDAKKCKKSKSEIFAATGLLHPTDKLQVLAVSYGTGCSKLWRYRSFLSNVHLRCLCS